MLAVLLFVLRCTVLYCDVVTRSRVHLPQRVEAAYLG